MIRWALTRNAAGYLVNKDTSVERCQYVTLPYA